MLKKLILTIAVTVLLPSLQVPAGHAFTRSDRFEFDRQALAPVAAESSLIGVAAPLTLAIETAKEARLHSMRIGSFVRFNYGLWIMGGYKLISDGHRTHLARELMTVGSHEKTLLYGESLFNVKRTDYPIRFFKALPLPRAVVSERQPVLTRSEILASAILNLLESHRGSFYRSKIIWSMLPRQIGSKAKVKSMLSELARNGRVETQRWSLWRKARPAYGLSLIGMPLDSAA